MKFTIDRTSGVLGKGKPCKGATESKIDHLEIRTCTEKYFDENFSKREGKWRGKGTDHKAIRNGKHIQRTIKDGMDVWIIEVNTLEELMALKAKHGELILGVSWRNYTQPHIEIYDGYRE